MDTEGSADTLNSLQNLNQNTPKCFVSINPIDARLGKGIVEYWLQLWVPCQVITIAKSWLDKGDASRFGRVGEIFAHAAFIVYHEARIGLGQGFTSAGWYWQNRHVLSAIGIRYFGTNPDFVLHWSSTVTEWRTYNCFLFWCSLSGRGHLRTKVVP